MVVSLSRQGNVGIITVDHPPVNAISAAVRAGILEALAQAQADGALEALVLAASGRTFMAGADITEFAKGPAGPTFHEVCQALEAAPKPIVAALHGTAFGGGLELALCCTARVAVPSAQVGLPEVKLGILPGAGGTQRLPRLVGVAAALDIIVSGDPVAAPQAAKAGVVDALIEGDLLAGAVAYAQSLLAKGQPYRRVRDITIDPESIPADFFAAARARFAKERRNQFAPQKIVDAVEAAVVLDIDAGLERERALIAECFVHPQARALQHVFFAERQVAKIPNLAKETQSRPIAKVAIIGAGTMGGGIAMNFANAGIPVTLLEVSAEGLERGLGVVRKNYEASAAKGKLTAAQVEARMAHITPTLAYSDLADADLIIEAVFETLDVKRQVFQELDKVAKAGAILASNTSYLSIDTIAQYTTRPADVVGLHFFSPANVMRLLEIVRGEKTAPDVLATSLELARRIKKIGVVAGNCHGFIGNRMLEGYGREANLLVLEGASPAQVDKVLFDFGMPMGAFAMSDMAGLDIGYRSRKERQLTNLQARAGRVGDKLVEAGRLGLKSGAGFYDYAPGSRTPMPSDATAQIIAQVQAGEGISARKIDDQEILERCFFALVNEGLKILGEGMAYRASDIDIVYINGYGFPAYRGGPMHWAENAIGLKTLLERLQHYAAQTGAPWWTPAPLLERLVSEGRSLASI
jgi:3-hydroxyacyl-CoA dehydrogenase